MVKKSLSQAAPPNLAELLARYREDRARLAGSYYNAPADRAAAMADLRPVLEAFLENRILLNDYISQLSEQSRRTFHASKGREGGSYWRLNGACRLFLESFYKI